MPEQPHAKRQHLVLQNTSQAIGYKARSTGRGRPKNIPDLPRAQHGASLRAQLDALKPAATTAVQVQQEQHLESGLGLQIQFASQPDIQLAFESLADARKKIELLSLRADGNQMIANVFVPDGQLAHFEKYVTEYLEEKKDKRGNPRDHLPLLNTIASIRAAELRALWTDDPNLLPTDPSQAFWWEVWLPVRGQREAVIEDFKKLARLAECTVSDQHVEFPERTVLLMHGSQEQLSRSLSALNCIAELRLAKETAEFFDGMAPDEQRDWSDELLERVQFVGEDGSTPRVCLLDTGVNRGHPLLEPLTDTHDLHTVDPAWGHDDTANHGTGLAGIAGYGDLTHALASDAPIVIRHRLESVKLVPDDGQNQGDAQHHAYLFTQGVARPEIAAPNRLRVFTSAVTASDYRDQGRPSAWSSTVDSLAADPDNAGEYPRLFVLSAGNIRDPDAWRDYPHSLATNLAHDPGQAWNALTVGACTYKIDTGNHPSLKPIAAKGGLSPFTTTSWTWEPMWPLKPDVVFEGGNAAKDDSGAIGMTDLNLLTTHNKPLERLFTTTNATSAASALCARMCAQIMEAYPQLRPETIRALLVHSAEWTPDMLDMYLPSDRNPNKEDYVNLIRHCGWGVPDLDRALWSAGNSLTLVVEDQIHPYAKVDSKIVTREMNLHELPWPQQELEDLQDELVELRVTLSYFIEPNPSARGSKSKFHYPSHRLKFDVQRPLDSSTDDFVARVNAAAEHDDNGDRANPADANWRLGGYKRHRGSLHQDVWTGTAADLANRGFIAVYPSNGWWRTRTALKRYDLPARYSLVVSIRTQQTDVDLYNAIAQRIAAATRIAIGT